MGPQSRRPLLSLLGLRVLPNGRGGETGELDCQMRERFWLLERGKKKARQRSHAL